MATKSAVARVYTALDKSSPDLVSVIHSPRALIQLKCVKRLRMERKLGWTEAERAWYSEGFAARFAEVYDKNPERSCDDIYHLVVHPNG